MKYKSQYAVRDESYFILSYNEPFGVADNDVRQNMELKPYWPAEKDSYIKDNSIILNLIDSVSGSQEWCIFKKLFAISKKIKKNRKWTSKKRLNIEFQLNYPAKKSDMEQLDKVYLCKGKSPTPDPVTNAPASSECEYITGEVVNSFECRACMSIKG